MKEFLEKIKGNGMITALLSIVFGFTLIFCSEAFINTICYALGICVILVGVVFLIQYIKKDVEKDFYKKELVVGLCAIFAGVFIIFDSKEIQLIIPMVFGVIVLVSGFIKLQNALDLKRINNKSWSIILVLSLVNIILGFILVFKPGFVNKVLFALIGIGLVYSGISDFVAIYLFSSEIKKRDIHKKSEDNIID